MAQSGFTPISTYYTTTASAAPTAGNLVNGELAINITDGKLFYKDNAGVVQTIAGKAGAGVAGGSNTQVQYNSSGSLAGSANMTFNGTTLTLANDASISGLTVGKGGGAVATCTAVGASALTSNSGNRNTAFGNLAANATTTGNDVVAFGKSALAANTTGGVNAAFGTNALGANTTASNNAAFGSFALESNTGQNNTAVGTYALNANTTASFNTAVGYQAAYTNTTGTNLTAIGYQAGYTSNATDNTFVGRQAGQSTSSGGSNTALGSTALANNSTGADNTALGKFALVLNTTGAQNTSVGKDALYSNTTASNNTAVGYQAGYSNTTGVNNVFVGSSAGANTTGGYNTFVGTGTLAAGFYVTSGTKNTIIGGYGGNQGGLDIRTASNYIVLSDGDGNPRITVDGSANVYLSSPNNPSTSLAGIKAGVATTQAYFTMSHGNRTANAEYFYFQNANGTVGSISSSGSTTTYATSSDYRLKENISPMQNALATISALKPVTYDWKSGGSSQGFIAHELQEVIPDCVVGEKNGVDAEGKPVYQGIDTSFLVATLTAAIQELSTQVTTLQAQVTALQGK